MFRAPEVMLRRRTGIVPGLKSQEDAMAEGVPCALNPRYYLFKIEPEIIQPKKRGMPQFTVDFQSKLKYADATAKKRKKAFADALTPYAVKSTDHKNRWDLRVAVPHGKSKESVFSRCVAFSMLK